MSTVVHWHAHFGCTDNFFIRRQYFISHLVRREIPGNNLRGSFSHPAHLLRIVAQLCDGPGDCFGIFRWHEESSAGDLEEFRQLPALLEKFELGLSWLERVVAEQSIETFRATVVSVRGTHFWRYVIRTLPRGAADDPTRAGYTRFDLEGSLWMMFYETLVHIRTIQRLKLHQRLPLEVELPRVGYLRLPEYWGETDRSGPDIGRL